MADAVQVFEIDEIDGERLAVEGSKLTVPDSVTKLPDDFYVKSGARGAIRLIANFFTNEKLGYIHIVLPIDINAIGMYHITTRGYIYGSAIALDASHVGYMYNKNLVNTSISDKSSGPVEFLYYINSNDKVTIRMSIENNTQGFHYTTMRVESMRVGNGKLIESCEVIFTADEQI